MDFTREGAHSQPRILFYEDITGKQITQTLLNQALTRDNIEICEYMTMVDIISKDNVCGGVIVRMRRMKYIRSEHHTLFWHVVVSEVFTKTPPTSRILQAMDLESP